jgi:hypothetical protein
LADINQKNVFGDNVVNFNSPPDRRLTRELEGELVGAISKTGAKGVAIHYESDGETEDFANQIAAFLGARYKLSMSAHLMSGTPRRTFLLEPPAAGNDFAILRIGTR